MKITVVFPGQGSQSVGMLDAWRDQPSVKTTLDEASQALDFDIDELIHADPNDQLNQTEFTQPAMLTAGIACWRHWQTQADIEATWFAGHSLGEFTALVAAGVMSFTDAVQLVRQRGQLMQQAVRNVDGAMAAVLGLDDEIVESLCAEVMSESAPVVAANFNAPGQVVISGVRTAVEQCAEKAKTAGAKRAVILPVSVPAHSPLMASAITPLTDALNALQLKELSTPVWSYDGSLYDSVGDVLTRLPQQLTAPVHWTTIVQNNIRAEATHMVECGPGKVLLGLNKRMMRQLNAGHIACGAVYDEDSMSNTNNLMQNSVADSTENEHARCA